MGASVVTKGSTIRGHRSVRYGWLLARAAKRNCLCASDPEAEIPELHHAVRGLTLWPDVAVNNGQHVGARGTSMDPQASAALAR
jgi:hypothetical protein